MRTLLVALILALVTPVTAEPIHEGFIGAWAQDLDRCTTDSHEISQTDFLSCKLLAADQASHNKETDTVSQTIAMECSADGKPSTHFANLTLTSKDTMDVTHPRTIGRSKFVRCKKS